MATPLTALTDAFTSAALNTALWNANTGTVTQASARVALSATTSGSTLGASGPYEATGMQLYARVTPALAGTGGQTVTTTMTLQQDANNKAYFTCTPGTTWQAVVVNAGVSTTVTLPAFSPAAHAWWQIAESAGHWLFSVSADGTAWTQVASITYTWSAHAVTVAFAASAPSVAGQIAYIEHVNTPLPSATLMPSWPQVRLQVAFNLGGTSSAQPAYVDLSSRLRDSWSASPSGRQYELDQVQSGSMACKLWNLDGALDPTNTASAYYPNVIPMRQARLQAVWPPTRNLIPQAASGGTDAGAVCTSAGTFTTATGLAPAPTGHTTAYAWTVPGSTAINNVIGLGTNVAFSGPDPQAVPVTAGQSYTMTCWTAIGSGSLSLATRISWYDVTGTRITASVGTTTATTVLGTWTKLTTTLTAPAGAVCARPGVQLASVPAGTITVYTTAWQFEQAAAATPWTAGGIVTSLFTGFVERWTQTWTQQGTYGLVELTCVDALAGLSQLKLAPSFLQQLLSLTPTMVYALNEPSGAGQFNDTTGQLSARFGWAVPAGGSGASITTGTAISGTGFVGADGPVTTISNPSPGSLTASQGMYISAPWAGPWGPPTTGGWTRLICFRTTTVPAHRLMLWNAYGPGAVGGGAPGSQAYLQLFIDSSGHFNGGIGNATGSATSGIAVPDVVVTDGNWHIGMVQLSADGTTFTVTCDGIGYQTSTAGDYHPTGVTSDQVGVLLLSTGAYDFYNGDLAYIVEIPSEIGNTLAYDMGIGFSTGWAGETSAARAQRILTIAGSPLTLATRGATTPMGGASLGGVDAMSALTLVGDSEAGQAYTDGAGVVWVTGRQWRYLQPTATVTFGEQQGNGEVPYLGDVAIDFDVSHVYNTVTVTNQTGQNAPEQPPAVVLNTASQKAYLPRTLDRTINVQDPTVAATAASYLAGQYAQPLARASALTIDLAANPALWATVLALGFGTRAQLNRRPPTAPGAAAVTLQVFVEHLAWSGDDKGHFRVALQLTPAAPYTNWLVVAALHTTLASGATAGTNTITLAPLNGSANNPASAALPAGTVLTVGYGTATAESVTVQSVAASSPGYTSVVVTLTGNLASSHSSGAVVCQPVAITLPPTVAAGYPASLDAGATLTTTGPRAAY